MDLNTARNFVKFNAKGKIVRGRSVDGTKGSGLPLSSHNSLATSGNDTNEDIKVQQVQQATKKKVAGFFGLFGNKKGSQGNLASAASVNSGGSLPTMSPKKPLPAYSKGK